MGLWPQPRGRKTRRKRTWDSSKAGTLMRVNEQVLTNGKAEDKCLSNGNSQEEEPVHG